ncbi:histidine kinase/DNA gyrase B/HSP90-like ATPase [Mumia flava]|uniref:histidine kinase n=1 Tax=Mumia flava TaxID=1348852 RepID=A0A0B2BH41_9ACTN|nr:ATP-binding protein [Mumia flava]PJJ54237.1 histidine kinase/DNA gyrase B/HSP90-like ATPase [Mumia flava]
MLADELGTIELLAGLTEEQRSELASRADVVAFARDEVLWIEGEHADSWWVLLEGVVALSRRVGREDVIVARMDVPGRWAGGFQAWDDEGFYLATARATSNGRMLRLDATDLRALLDAWFPFGGHLVNGLYHTARSVESTVRQRASLITLGTLAAGLAHELNNPAAAATRAVDGLGEACDALLGCLIGLARHDLTPTQFLALDDLRSELRAAPRPPDALTLADREDELADWLVRHAVSRPRRLAATFAAAGADVVWAGRVSAALPGPALELGLGWVAATLDASTLLERTKESTRRVSELVASVRSYSQMDRASRQEIDVRDGLENTLTMLGHRLHGPIDVVRRYDDPPAIDAHPGELNQVWTNVISNALDAMDDAGTLTIAAYGEQDHVVVEIGDTGPGMPDDVAARAFEPFFTTKEIGDGTGLGLDIARRIVVERHGGTIDLRTSADGTTMVVRLPVHRAE